MQVNVQKSTRTTFPRRSASTSGDELTHPVAPSKPGRRAPIASLTSRLRDVGHRSVADGYGCHRFRSLGAVNDGRKPLAERHALACHSGKPKEAKPYLEAEQEDFSYVSGYQVWLPTAYERKPRATHGGGAIALTERRRSRTYPAWGCQTSPVLKVCSTPPIRSAMRASVQVRSVQACERAARWAKVRAKVL